MKNLGKVLGLVTKIKKLRKSTASDFIKEQEEKTSKNE